MSISLYDASVPPMIRGLRTLAHCLEKGRAFADERGMAHEELLDARLIGDMTPLVAQLQRASDSAKFCAVRVAGAENVPMADEEASIADLQDRIARTIAVLESVAPDAMDGREDAEVLLPLPDGGAVPFTGKSYVLDFAVPNFFFHVTTVYALLRMKGVPIGKRDYLLLG